MGTQPWRTQNAKSEGYDNSVTTGSTVLSWGARFQVMTMGSVIWGINMWFPSMVEYVWRIGLFPPTITLAPAWTEDYTHPANTEGWVEYEFSDANKVTIDGDKLKIQEAGGSSVDTQYSLAIWDAANEGGTGLRLTDASYYLPFQFGWINFAALANGQRYTSSEPARPNSGPARTWPFDPIIIAGGAEPAPVDPPPPDPDVGGDLAGGPRFRIGMEPKRNTGPALMDGSLQSDMQMVSGIQTIATFDGGTLED